ncbi:A-kinase anchor protein inhibitor 1 [Monodelphis domestica]|uniref:A-kinase anchor protein inhibitor 1 n=1 Tax=Monodelphis domestica TaxID=13616 RepID=UPI0004431E8D|nr:A-kinase anchor protein inhibitor 1 [Monodelphis domestica]XP_007487728.1 A-kinase anchor protein inhibitor 1 [Monodelphis domestica]XP_007487730.1 A-kinase anchor protein inhibitor 1 [Monodelphis domestica]XP_007487731.1 A-kinase anchor protein inhibitor 1 [Monodelphis domestica]XP_056679717.1 A-kinase anchor protein inhibitor 1 [Monodelphis domestica]XP_056679719.1 A-kinase anchor protein inhibitor 1 [Monodelphis domestica]XP_056679720.1 A-kinase anchor protein inhibitor 1 [Monodelphis d
MEAKPKVKPGNKLRSESEEVKLQKVSKQIVQNAILRAVQQVSQEIQQKKEGIASINRIGLQLEKSFGDTKHSYHHLKS